MNEKAKKRWILLGFAFLSLLLAIAPVLSPNGLGIIRVNDFNFHASRVESMANILQSPTNFEFFHHYGSPVNLCYPWLTLVPWYLFYLLTHHIVGSYLCFVGVLTFATLWLCYQIGWKMTTKRGIGVLFALLYSFSFYRLYNLYYRFAIGEAIAMTFLPLIIYALYQILYKKQTKAWYLLTIAMTLTAYTHFLSLLFYTLFIVLFYLGATVIRQAKKKEWWALVKAGFWSGLFSLGSMLPLIDLSLKHQLFTPEKGDVYRRALTIKRFIWNHLQFSFKASTYACGFLLLLCFFVVILYWRHYHWWFKELILFVVLSLVAVTRLFPWQKLQSTMLGSIQFPWRLYVFPTCFIALLAAIALYYWWKEHYIYLGLGLLFVMVHLGIVIQYANVPNHGREFYSFHPEAKIQKIVENRGKPTWLGSGRIDYYLKASQPYYKNFWQHRMYVDHHFVKVPMKVTPDEVQFNVNFKKEKEVILPVGAYSYMDVTMKGKPLPWKMGHTGGIEVTIPKGKQTLTVQAKYPKWILPLQGITLISFFGFMGYHFWTKKKRKR